MKELTESTKIKVNEIKCKYKFWVKREWFYKYKKVLNLLLNLEYWLLMLLI